MQSMDALNAPMRLRVGRWQVDASADEIASEGQVVKLEPLQMKLLLALAARPGQVVRTQELLDAVWRDLVVTPNSVYQAVAQLRRQLGDSSDEPAYIQTVHRKGYRLIAAVSAEAPAPQAPLPEREASPATMAVPAAPPRRDRRRLVAVSALAGLAAVLGGVAFWRGRREAEPAAVRLAVLPFTDRSPGGVEQALARGLAQDVARLLGRHAELQVVAPDALLDRDFGADNGDPAATARRLGVQVLLQGELSRHGPALRLQARLVAPPRAEPVWQQSFEQGAAQASQLPGAVAQQVSTALALKPALPAPAVSAAAEAYELYVLGNDAWRPKTQEAFAKARAYFQRGIDVDPAYGRNYVGLGWTWLGQATTGAGLDLPRAVALATPLFDRALRLEPSSAEALAAQATLHQFAGEFERARELLLNALAANPNYAQAHFTLGIVEFDSGWPLRALTHFERTAVLNPLSASPFDRLAVAQLFAGRIDAAQASARRAIALEPAHPNGHWSLGIAGYASGDLVQAVGGYREALEREPRRPYLWLELARLYLDLERPAEAAAAFARCVEQLPGAGWPSIHAALAWLAQPARGAVPVAIESMPEDGSVAEWALIRSMAGLPLDAAALRRALDAAAARGDSLTPAPWFVFQGSHRLVDLATVLTVLGEPAAAAPHLESAATQLDALERQGNRWHALHLQRARLLALRAQPRAALDALEAAVAAGSRRGWWLRLDPAVASLRGERAFATLLDDLSTKVAAQRRQLGF